MHWAVLSHRVCHGTTGIPCGSATAQQICSIDGPDTSEYYIFTGRTIEAILNLYAKAIPNLQVPFDLTTVGTGNRWCMCCI